MPLITGEQAIAALADRLDELDPGESSHWADQHRNFAFNKGELSGLGGFGNLTSQQTGLKRVLHTAFQSRYRRMGSGFPLFEKMDALAKTFARRQSRFCDLDMLRQALTLAFVHARLPKRLEKPGMTALVIGDGYGMLSSLILTAFPEARVILINLTKTLLADMVFCRAALPEEDAVLVETSKELASALGDKGSRLITVEARNDEILADAPIDIAFNIASMQEMDPPVIAAYFEHLRSVSRMREVHFYCCNRVEKALPDGTITRFDDYPWIKDDEVLVDELCPWHQFSYALRPPFFRPYDGPIRHRLARMAAEGSRGK